jgi:hypothetical protein
MAQASSESLRAATFYSERLRVFLKEVGQVKKDFNLTNQRCPNIDVGVAKFDVVTSGQVEDGVLSRLAKKYLHPNAKVLYGQDTAGTNDTYQITICLPWDPNAHTLLTMSNLWMMLIAVCVLLLAAAVAFYLPTILSIAIAPTN